MNEIKILDEILLRAIAIEWDRLFMFEKITNGSFPKEKAESILLRLKYQYVFNFKNVKEYQEFIAQLLASDGDFEWGIERILQEVDRGQDEFWKNSKGWKEWSGDNQ